MVAIDDQLLIKLGQAKEEAGRAWKLVQITVAAAETVSPVGMLHYRLDKNGCELSAAAKVVTCCAPICWEPIQHGFERCTSN